MGAKYAVERLLEAYNWDDMGVEHHKGWHYRAHGRVAREGLGCAGFGHRP